MPDIILNGQSLNVRSHDLLGLIKERKLRMEHIAVEIDGELVKRSDWEATIIQDGNKIEIVSFVGGG